MAAIPLTLQDLKACFPSGVWSRAQGLVRDKAVKFINWQADGTELYSKVRSASSREEYIQSIEIDHKKGRLNISGGCSCYVGFNCKHVAAALIVATEQLQEKPAVVVSPKPEPVKPEPTLNAKEKKLFQLVQFVWEQRGSLHEPYLGQLREVYRKAPKTTQSKFDAKLWQDLWPLLESEEGVSDASTVHPDRAEDATPALNLSPELQNWLDAPEAPRALNHTLLFVVQVRSDQKGQTNLHFEVYSARISKQGLSDVKPYTSGFSDAQYVARDLPLKVALGQVQDWHGLQDLPLTGHVLQALLDTGRVYLQDHWDQPITTGETRKGTLGWKTASDGTQRPVLQVEPEGTVVLPHARPWYLDVHTKEIGRVELPVSEQEAQRFLSIPALSPLHSTAFAQHLQARHQNRYPLPHTLPIQSQQAPLVPRITLYTQMVRYNAYSYPFKLHSLHLEWTYNGEPVRDFDSPILQRVENGVVYTLQRDLKKEQATEKPLKKLKLDRAEKVQKNRIPDTLKNHWTFRSNKPPFYSEEQTWLSFISEDVPGLQKLGWEVRFDPSFEFRLSQVSHWYADLEEGSDWFGLELGVMVEGQKISVLPLLVSLIRSTNPEMLKTFSDEDTLYARLPDRSMLPMPVGRIRSLLGTLIELYGQDGLKDGKVRMPLLDAARLAELEAEIQPEWQGGEKLRELGKKLRDFQGLQTADLPKGLQATLRPYQHEGLNWLQFLREYGLNGILADDMGLGKTLQTLTHLLLEKEQGRLTSPALIVAPTSLMHNWMSEARKFTPELKVLILQGAQRKQDFSKIKDHDIVLSTYPLISRDFEVLSGHTFHTIILDEAQNIKNAKSATSKAIFLLKAQHRLCLTGTPLENHLGELWSLFQFLMPGFLGDTNHFGKLYRTPIEKQGDVHRRTALAKRIKPFILRRTKTQVAKELPPKTEVVVNLPLDGAQRDLYETLRVSVQKQVQQEIQSKGLARSHIMILDALLKLRQVCCEPRLLSLTEARKVKTSVKLEWLKDTLPGMLEEGQRVLLFSQFATLLGLLEETLKELGIPYSKLTGETQDRKTQIEQFQQGKTHVFLISLKAGGVGLNLTAADTVIHFDPWWNPAAENQATDRAYRIGQDKPVFVYKLITEGTIEEKILGMQERKAQLASGVLEGGLAEAQSLSAEDVQNLFAPL
ncbi:DEAD/DEAH box helicase [Deinococcus misasensis]|uniref:DEAD/DEAH box helicase n=1 Tax=Deinococcus misasensis TaxID=392413 RepID=UPI000691ACFA|nr:DEAD/DEAH box helicase [Deinococcus misasensis]